eukprot:TRINITY_DN75269_c0_g1_i1.p1 TRINITY_DN75269_c0_g1~~TRINITY_DN75269_c0_g1_i1.p1  ORF type:complete len:422 (+),score=38.46 TRINITY_DN75269_c0_g1_i1:66-1331(+)
MDDATRAFFRDEQQDPSNRICVDDGSPDPQWASISHGCYISIGSSGIHRGLGVHISFVRSIAMDSWKPVQLKQMKLGGNKKLREFLERHGVPNDTPIARKYRTRAAEWYRLNLRALAEGTTPPPPLPDGTGHLPMVDGSHVEGLLACDPSSSGGAQPSSYAQLTTRAENNPNNAEMQSQWHRGGYHDAASVSNPTLSALTGSNGEQKFDSHVSGKIWDSVGAVTHFAENSRSYLNAKRAEALQHGWLDTVVSTTTNVVGTVIESSTRVTQTDARASSDDDKANIFHRTSELLGGTARVMVESADWLADSLRDASSGGQNKAVRLQQMSSGKMQGFGSEHYSYAKEPVKEELQAGLTGAGLNVDRQQRLAELWADEPASTTGPTSAVESMTSSDSYHQVNDLEKRAAAKASLWNDDDWNDFS